MLRKTALIAFFAVLGLPAAFVLTFATFPFWRWLDETFRVEAFGHSGPAGWCFVTVYALLLLPLSAWIARRKPVAA